MKAPQISTKNHSKKESKAAVIWRRMRKNSGAMIGLVILLIFALLTIFANVICPEEMVAFQDASIRLQGPSAAHIFGTDAYGRDIFARVLYGGRISLTIGLFTAFFALLIGGTLGATAAFYGGKVENFIMRSMDIFTAIPGTLMALAIVATLGTSIINLLIAITISSIPGFATLIRSSVLTVVEADFIEAARACATKDSRIIIRHILPNAIGPIIVQTTQSIASMIRMAASLSFIGMGVQPPTPEWGYMINEAREFLHIAPHLMIFPGGCIILASLAFNLIGDGLRDAFDPRLYD